MSQLFVEKLSPTARTQKQTVMVVEDDPELLNAISDVLSLQGYRIVKARNGREALDLLNQNPTAIEVILSDIHMPQMTGLELYEAFKGKSKAPFILMTGYSELLTMEQAYAMGVNEFIPKPFQTEDLLSCLEVVCQESVGGLKASHATLNQDYCRIHIDEFITGSKAAVDVFLKIGDDKFLRVAKKESPLPADRIENYKRKGVNYFF